ncbi:PucR family transcriptional regulator [Nocardia jejuensis]|uniref:PucR family transcriptional regulator n=1 Tax=Nocardia jejuensis TaxID=328049 RepID=UPI000836A12C|nr:helix-turn-helix domain-containing protein [Nocardia jejuensis]
MSISSTTGRTALAQVAQNLLDSVDTLADTVTARIIDAERSYLETQLLTDEQLRGSVLDNLTEIFEYLSGRHPIRLESARATGRLKAEQGIPLAAALHAFRLGGRLIWEEYAARAEGISGDELMKLAAALWEVVDLCSEAAAEGYRDTEAELVRADAQVRAHLTRTLFDDHSENPARVLETLRALSLPETGTFVVVAAEAGRMSADGAGAVAERLRARGIASVWDQRIDSCVGLICGRSEADIATAETILGSWTESTLGSAREAILDSAEDAILDSAQEAILDSAQEAILDSAHEAILAEEPSARVGLSRSTTRPTTIAVAYDEARLALRCGRAGSAAVTRYGADPIPLLLVQLPEAAHRAAEQILGPVLSLPAPERAELLATLRAWFDHAGSNPAAARHLHCHRNTMLYRLRKIRDLTGRDCDNPAQAAELFVALQAVQLRGDRTDRLTAASSRSRSVRVGTT